MSMCAVRTDNHRTRWIAAIVLGAAVVAPSAIAGELKTTLHSFAGRPDGDYPFSALTALPSGWLVGTTDHGGVDGQGTVFRINRKGATSVIHSFSLNGASGAQPTSPVTLGSDGLLYGLTSYGGQSNLGTVFQLKLNGKYKVLHHFDGPGGALPTLSRMVEGNDGALYGVTWLGGAQDMGVLFRITKRGRYSVLHQFVYGTDDGARPYSDLVRGADGYIYGTCTLGGSFNNGTVFRFNEAGNYETVASFPERMYPQGGMVVDGAGTIYGASRQGGANGNGTVFKYQVPQGLSVLYSFPAIGNAIGFYPEGGLTLAPDGKMYGTTFGGGDNLKGGIFRIDFLGAAEPVYAFLGYSDGSNPHHALTATPTGDIYGVMSEGGDFDNGYVYRLEAK